jgi:hypothetical protein
VVRLTMAFQFQSVAAVARLSGSEFGVILADTRNPISQPCAGIAGGAIGRGFGDGTPVVGAVILLLIDTLAMALSDSSTGLPKVA